MLLHILNSGKLDEYLRKLKVDELFLKRTLYYINDTFL